MEETHEAKTKELLNELNTDISFTQEESCKTNNELRDMLEQILADTTSANMQLKLESLIRKFKKHLLLIFDNNECVLMSPKSTKGIKDVLKNAELTYESNDDNENYYMRKIIYNVTANRKTPLEFSKLRAVTGVDQHEETMIVLRDTYCERLKCLYKKHIKKNIIDGHTQTLFKLNEDGIKCVLKDTGQKLIANTTIERWKNQLKDFYGCPIYNHPTKGDKSQQGAKEKKLTTHLNEALEDKKIKQALQRLGKYFVHKTSITEEEKKCFNIVMDRIAILGSPDRECLKLLKSKELIKDRTRALMYRIGAFMINTNTFFEFSAENTTSKIAGWRPLSYGMNGNCHTLIADPMEQKDRDAIIQMTLGIPSTHIRPKIYCILNVGSETKAINGTIVDILERRKQLLKEWKIPSLEIGSLPLIDNSLSEMKYMEQKWSDIIPKYKKFKPDYHNYLPIFNMEIADQKIRSSSIEDIMMNMEKNTDNTEHESKNDIEDKNIKVEQHEKDDDNDIKENINKEISDDVTIEKNEDNENKDNINDECDDKEIVKTTIKNDDFEKTEELNNDVTINIVIDKKTLLLERNININIRLTKDGIEVKKSTLNDNSIQTKEVSFFKEISSKSTTNAEINTDSVVMPIDVKKHYNEKKKSTKKVKAETRDKAENKPQESMNEELAIGTRTTLDLYGTGKLKTTTFVYNKEVPYNDIYKVRARCDGPPNIKKNIPTELLNVMRRKLMRAATKTKLQMLLNLPQFLAECPGETEAFNPNGSKSETDTISLTKRREWLAITQFYNGETGKAYKTLTGKQAEHINPAQEEVDKLFPEELVEPDKLEVKKNSSDDNNIDIWSLDKLLTDKQLITAAEVKSTLSSLPNRKSTGISGLSYEHLKQLGRSKKTRVALTSMLNDMLTDPENCIHPQLFVSRLVGVRKKDGGLRPLCIQESVIKLFHKVLVMKINNIAAVQMQNIQYCIDSRDGQLRAKDNVKENIQQGYNKVILFDFTNAFGSINRVRIIERLEKFNVPNVIIEYLKFLFNKLSLEYISDKGERIQKRITRGTPQGDPLSMLLFAVGIDGLLEDIGNIEGVKITAYADDIAVQVKNKNEVLNVIKRFTDEAKKYGLNVNLSKSHIGICEEIEENIKNEWIKEGLDVTDIRVDKLVYLGLPLTLNSLIAEKFLEEKTSEYLEKSKELWTSGTPLQFKYHVQRMCLDSKLSYLIKGIDLPNGNQNYSWMEYFQDEMEKILNEWLDVIPEQFRYIPIKYYGAGFTNIEHMRQIQQIIVETKKMKKNITENEAKEIFYSKLITDKMKNGNIQYYNWKCVPTHANTSISSPPNGNAQRLNNLAFKMLWATRYKSTKLDHIAPKGTQAMCESHPNAQLNLSHILSCTKYVQSVCCALHNDIVKIIKRVMDSNTNITWVDAEKYTPQEMELRENGQKGKRADIVYTKDGVDKSLDISVTTSWSQNSSRNSVNMALQSKKCQYKAQDKAHIILLDTSGLMTEDTRRILKDIGCTSYDVRKIQTLIFTADADRYLMKIQECKRNSSNLTQTNKV